MPKEDANIKKQTEAEILSGLQEVRKAYVQGVSQQQSIINIILQPTEKSNAKEEAKIKKADRKKLRSETGLWDKDMSRVPNISEPIG